MTQTTDASLNTMQISNDDYIQGFETLPKKFYKNAQTSEMSWEVVVAQLVERLLPNLDVRGFNPVSGKIYIEYSLSTVLKRRQ